MNAYKYKAVSKNGKEVSGIVEATDEYEAVDQIKQSCKFVLSINQVKSTKQKKDINLNEPMWVSEKVLALCCGQFAILLRSGLPTARTVEVIAGQTDDKLLKRILLEVAEDVKAGLSLARSFEIHGKKIPETFIETVRAGEDSGTLETSFKKLEDYYKKKSSLSGKVRSALTYPILLCVLAAGVIVVVIKIAVPTILGNILDTGGTIPFPTQVLMNVYNFFEKFGLALIIAIVLLVAGFLAWKRTEEGKMECAKIALKIPIIKNINIMNSASQFAATMTTLLLAGLPTMNAIKVTGKVMDNYAVGTEVSKASAGLEEGRRLGEVLENNQYLPNLLKEMAAVGEESGSLEETLTTIGTYYDQETELATAKAMSLMEPIITIVLGIVIGFIVIALYLPMFTMYNTM